jgi:predicted metal-dependent hydrolase
MGKVDNAITGACGEHYVASYLSGSKLLVAMPRAGKTRHDRQRLLVAKDEDQVGSCNHSAGQIRLKTELVKKPKDLLEYVVVHEIAHLLEPTHNDCFVAILDKRYPTWREARAELNELPLAAEVWR